MDYQKLGNHGLKVSRLSFGSWVTFGNQMDTAKALACMQAAFDAGVNFFDNAEVYAGGQSEEVMGQVLKKTGWNRLDYVLSTKFFWGIHKGQNSHNTLNRKYLMSAIEGSLKRLQMEFVDLIYCHRPDPDTPIEETCWAMNDIISSGKALYWGTSEWSVHELNQAFAVCEKRNLRKPIVEQPQYNFFHREKVEKEFKPLYDKEGLGLTIWSPLASGVLSGKYLNGIPAGSRLSQESLSWMKEEALNPARLKKTEKFVAMAKEFSCTPAQLALAWCLKNPNVSTVITGASNVEQVHENMKALEVFHRLTPASWSEVDKILKLLRSSLSS